MLWDIGCAEVTAIRHKNKIDNDTAALVMEENVIMLAAYGNGISSIIIMIVRCLYRCPCLLGTWMKHETPSTAAAAAALMIVRDDSSSYLMERISDLVTSGCGQ